MRASTLQVLLGLVLVSLDSCATGSPCGLVPVRSTTFNIAIPLHGPPMTGLRPQLLPSNPLLLTPPYYQYAKYDMLVFRAAQLYEERVHARGGIRLMDNTSMPMKLWYWNIGPNLNASSTLADKQRYFARGNLAASLLANATGPLGFFPVVIPPCFSAAGSQFTDAFFLACEASQTCVTIGAIEADPATHICANPRPPDCIARGRPVGSRRFKFGLSTFVDPTYDFQGHLTLFRQQGINRIALLFDSGAYTIATYAQTQALAESLAFTVVYKLLIGPTSQLIDLPGNLTAASVAQSIIDANPGALVIQISPTSPAAADAARVLVALKAQGWTPQAMSFGGGSDTLLAPLMSDPSDLDYAYTTFPWDFTFRGAGYHAVDVPGVNFEVFSANTTFDSPEQFAATMNVRWPPGPIAFGGHIFACVMAQALITAPKLLEVTLVDNAPLMVQASFGLSVPSIYHRLQFDPFGRIIVQDTIILQRLPGGNLRTLSPANIAVAGGAVFPMPTWQERQFHHVYAHSIAERAMLAVNSLVLLYLCGWLLFIAIRRTHPVIRAATPVFCGLLLFGCVCMTVSNYFFTLDANDVHCTLSNWFLFVGFTLTFSSLFIKTFRIWKIFFAGKLVVQKIQTGELVKWIGVILLLECSINAAWSGMGHMEAMYVQVDPWRPQYDYYTCANGTSSAYLVAHATLKGLLIVVGMFLTYAVRKVPSQFNESLYIMISIYNVAAISVFVLPLIVAGTGGPTIVFQIRAYAVMFVCASTASIMFWPKWISMHSMNVNGGGGGGGAVTDQVTKASSAQVSHSTDSNAEIPSFPPPPLHSNYKRDNRRTRSSFGETKSFLLVAPSQQAPSSPSASSPHNNGAVGSSGGGDGGMGSTKEQISSIEEEQKEEMIELPEKGREEKGVAHVIILPLTAIPGVPDNTHTVDFE